ncbi:hypothetical protein Avbf_08789 [Armadillidium vulgare]|nr:hypothetical protein Avbf_08789 [Armadillidium vulgare]
MHSQIFKQYTIYNKLFFVLFIKYVLEIAYFVKFLDGRGNLLKEYLGTGALGGGVWEYFEIR